MFDRGLISIDDDYGLLLKREAIPSSVLGLVNRDRRLRVPEQRMYWPHRRFLDSGEPQQGIGRSEVSTWLPEQTPVGCGDTVLGVASHTVEID